MNVTQNLKDTKELYGEENRSTPDLPVPFPGANHHYQFVFRGHKWNILMRIPLISHSFPYSLRSYYFTLCSFSSWLFV